VRPWPRRFSDRSRLEPEDKALLRFVHDELVSLLGVVSIARAAPFELDRQVQLETAARGLMELIELIERSAGARDAHPRSS
jgi:hypothetical protein